jgi:hypothetical protein
VNAESPAPARPRARGGARWLWAILLGLLIIVSTVVFLLLVARVARVVLEVRHGQQVQAGLATGVRPWMTLPYIARTYGVPEGDLCAALGVPDSGFYRRASLRAIARHDHRDTNADIAALNAVIDTERGRPTAPAHPLRPTLPHPATPPGAP